MPSITVLDFPMHTRIPRTFTRESPNSAVSSVRNQVIWLSGPDMLESQSIRRRARSSARYVLAKTLNLTTRHIGGIADALTSFVMLRRLRQRYRSPQAAPKI